MLDKVFHGIGDECLTGASVVVVLSYDETSEVLVDTANGLARADGGSLGRLGGRVIQLRVTIHVR